MKLPNLDLAFIDRNKLWNYSLNTQHDRGKHKARLFAAILDLGRNENDVEILQTLIIEAIQNYEAIPSQSDQYGQRYIVDFPSPATKTPPTSAPLGSSVPMKISLVSLVVIS